MAASESKGEETPGERPEQASKTVEGIRSAWVKDQQVLVEDERVTTYRVNLKVTFVLQD